MKLPRNAQIWLPGYVLGRVNQWKSFTPSPKRAWLSICDHFEPLWNKANVSTARGRVHLWRERWPVISSRVRDSAGNAPRYTFFYPQEEYLPELLDPLAEMTHASIADVEVHIHHERETREEFVRKMTEYCSVLHQQHGLLRRRDDGKLTFGFIHGDWALDNSLPDGRCCGLTGEIGVLHDLGCYADFTMPSGNSLTQARTVNTIYWCKRDPSRPKAYDYGIAIEVGGGIDGDLLMIPGPLGIRWKGRLLPRFEVGELAGNDPPTLYRVRRWFDIAPRIGEDLFIKLYTHGAQERNSSALLNGALSELFALISQEAARRACRLYFVSSWQTYLAIDAIRRRLDPLEAAINSRNGEAGIRSRANDHDTSGEVMGSSSALLRGRSNKC